MCKLLKSLILVVGLLFVSDLAEAAARFAVCTTTCTWDNTSTAMWSASSGGATGASAPTSADTVTFDAATCVGGTTCTITTFAGTISAQSITWGACTASTTGCIIDADTNDTNFTINGIGVTLFSGTGTGTRKWLAGSGTYTLTISNTNGCFSMATTTNDQGSVFSGATWNCTVTAANTWTWNGGGFSFGPTTINGNSGGGNAAIGGTNTFASLTVNGPNWLAFPKAATTTVTGALTLNGSSSTPVMLTSTDIDTIATVSLGAASTGTWTTLRVLTTSGAAALTATNCLSFLRVTLANGGSCTAPVVGGEIIGG